MEGYLYKHVNKVKFFQASRHQKRYLKLDLVQNALIIQDFKK